MVLMSSTEGVYDRRQRSEMLRIARASIAHGLNHGTPLPVRPGDFDPALRELRASRAGARWCDEIDAALAGR